MGRNANPVVEKIESYSREDMLKRRLLDPTEVEIDDGLRRVLQASDSSLGSMPSWQQAHRRMSELSQRMADEQSMALMHELSIYIDCPQWSYHSRLAADQREALIYQEWLEGLVGELTIDDITRFNAMAVGGSGSTRTAPSYVASHDGSIRIHMVDWQAAQARMQSLPTLLNDGRLGAGLEAAVRALAFVNNAHAFSDGNGRLGRGLFNYCLHQHGMPSASYIPLKTLNSLSRGGYEISLREVELFGRWRALMEYHERAVDLVRQWGNSSVARKETVRVAVVQ